MQIPVFDLTGKSQAAWDFDPKSLGKINEPLLSQALRVYESNSHQKTHKVKTRGEVDGSTKKIYKQKGTGGARHGARYAPIFVGGGIAHGPTGVRPDNRVLPRTMRRRALASAILSKLAEKSLVGMTKVKSADGKTSSTAKFLALSANHPKTSVLVVTESSQPTLYRGVSNLQGTLMKRAALVNTYDMIAADVVVLTKKALDSLVARATDKPVVVETPKSKTRSKKTV